MLLFLVNSDGVLSLCEEFWREFMTMLIAVFFLILFPRGLKRLSAHAFNLVQGSNLFLYKNCHLIGLVSAHNVVKNKTKMGVNRMNFII